MWQNQNFLARHPRFVEVFCNMKTQFISLCALQLAIIDNLVGLSGVFELFVNKSVKITWSWCQTKRKWVSKCFMPFLPICWHYFDLDLHSCRLLSLYLAIFTTIISRPPYFVLVRGGVRRTYTYVRDLVTPASWLAVLVLLKKVRWIECKYSLLAYKKVQ